VALVEQAFPTAGGGGAGGMRCTVTATGGGGSLPSALSVTKGTGYTVTVGAGGAGAADSTTDAGTQGSSGNSSVFASGQHFGRWRSRWGLNKFCIRSISWRMRWRSWPKSHIFC
jgi:hypothetical protein